MASDFEVGQRFLALLEGEIERLRTLSPDSGVVYLGRLSIKEEAAGKARVFAITDLITQSVMSPLHHCLFGILKKLPMDGTFNQSLPLDRLRQRYADGKLNGQEFYSYDLSAATDRIPIALQQQVLSCWFGEDYSSLWASLLTNRD